MIDVVLADGYGNEWMATARMYVVAEQIQVPKIVTFE